MREDYATFRVATSRLGGERLVGRPRRMWADNVISDVLDLGVVDNSTEFQRDSISSKKYK